MTRSRVLTALTLGCLLATALLVYGSFSASSDEPAAPTEEAPAEEASPDAEDSEKSS